MHRPGSQFILVGVVGSRMTHPGDDPSCVLSTGTKCEVKIVVQRSSTGGAAMSAMVELLVRRKLREQSFNLQHGRPLSYGPESVMLLCH